MKRRRIVIFAALLLWAGISSAAPFWFSQKAGAGSGTASADDLAVNNGQVITNLNAAELTCSRTNVGAALIYSVVWSGSDFNGNGTNDTLSYELRVEGFDGSTYSYSTNAFESSMTALGASSDVTAIGNIWGVGGDYDVDAGQSLRFSVTNVQLSAPGYNAEFDGFTVEVIEPGGREHRLILGEGTGLEGNEFNAATAVYTFLASDQLVITGAGSYYAGTHEWAVRSMGFKFNVSDPSDPPVWDVSDYSDFVTGPGYLDEYPAQESLSNYPEFSWDTVPRWLIIRNGNVYSEADIQTMATNYEVIVFEKANTAGFASTEAGILDTAARVRAVDPTTKNIFYWNSYINYGGYEANALYDNWEWSNHTTNSGPESIYLLRDLYSTYNYSVPEMRDWWVNAALGMVSNSVIDGVFIDKSHDLDRSWVLGPDVSWVLDAVPASDYLSMIMALEEGLPEGKLHTGNTLRNEKLNGNRAYMEFMEGSYLERWTKPDRYSTPVQGEVEATAVSLQLMREALAKGKFIMFKTNGDATSQETLAATVDYPLALFLIVAETNAYFAYQGDVNAAQADWLWDTSYLPEFSRPLGQPLGDPVRDGTIYTRSYEHMDVRVDISTGETLLAWDSVDTDADGMSDLWELQHFGGTTHAAVTGNPDGDAYTNLEEYDAGLDPNSPDPLEILNLDAGAGSAFEWNTVDGRFYNVYWSSNLLDGFTLVGSNVPGGVFVDAEHAAEPRGFYKLAIESLAYRAQGSGTSKSDPFPATFTPFSATDLANVGQPTLSNVTWGTGMDAAHGPRINDGVMGSSADDNTTIVSIENGADDWFEITFDTSVNTAGYDITGIISWTGWNPAGGGRANQGYTITVTYMDDSTEVISGGTYYDNAAGNSWSEVRFTDRDTGIIAGGVKAIRFDDFDEAATTQGGVVTYREFDVLGSPSALD